MTTMTISYQQPTFVVYLNELTNDCEGECIMYLKVEYKWSIFLLYHRLVAYG